MLAKTGAATASLGTSSSWKTALFSSLLTERRAGYAPYGLAGGGDGQTGRNLLIKPPTAGSAAQNNNNTIVSLGGKNKVVVSKGERIRILTPGGGGYGAVGSGDAENDIIGLVDDTPDELLYGEFAGSGTALGGNRVDF